jgi:phosphotransacetylase
LTPWSAIPPTITSFTSFSTRCKALPAITTAVVWPLSDVALKGTVEAAVEGLIEPTLIGDEAELKALAAKIGVDISGYPIVQADSESQSSRARRSHVPQPAMRRP